MNEAERERVVSVLTSERSIDRSPGEVVATLLDEGEYLCSERTMYRVLAERAPVRERRNQLQHPKYEKPQLMATAPNQVWSWDIERHEALSNRVVMKGHDRQSVAAEWLKLRAA